MLGEHFIFTLGGVGGRGWQQQSPLSRSGPLAYKLYLTNDIRSKTKAKSRRGGRFPCRCTSYRGPEHLLAALNPKPFQGKG